MIVPGKGFLIPSVRVPGVSPGMVLDEIDTCIRKLRSKPVVGRTLVSSGRSGPKIKLTKIFILQLDPPRHSCPSAFVSRSPPSYTKILYLGNTLTTGYVSCFKN